MIFRLSLGVALLTLIFALPDVARSQTLIGPPSGFGIGIFAPTDSRAKQGGDTQLNAELRYSFIGIPLTNSRTLVDLGYEGGRDNGHSTIIPLTIGEYFGDGKIGGSPYIGAGVGGYYFDQTGSSTTARIGGYLAAGYRFTIAFIEAKYQVVNKGNGLLLDAGITF